MLPWTEQIMNDLQQLYDNVAETRSFLPNLEEYANNTPGVRLKQLWPAVTMRFHPDMSYVHPRPNYSISDWKRHLSKSIGFN